MDVEVAALTGSVLVGMPRHLQALDAIRRRSGKRWGAK